MEEGGRCDEPRLAGIEPEVAAHDPGQVHRPERVLKPGVVCAGVDEVCKPELGYVAESLDRPGIEQPERELVSLDVAVDRVFDDLHLSVKVLCRREIKVFEGATDCEVICLCSSISMRI